MTQSEARAAAAEWNKDRPVGLCAVADTFPAGAWAGTTEVWQVVYVPVAEESGR